jgi:hypothetical protein
MDRVQDWCLQCGAGAPGSLSGSGARWRSTAVILGACAILVGGSAAAAYAALSQKHSNAHPPASPAGAAVAQVPTQTTPGGALTPSTSTTPVTPSAAGVPQTTTPTSSVPSTPGGASTKAGLPSTPAKPPQIPFFTTAPKASGGGTGAPSTSTTKTGSENNSSTTPSTTDAGETGAAGAPGTSKPSPILLDTNAASTYNPYAYPAANFGDPALAIDGEPATAWTAQVDPAVAPRMAEGLTVDLKSAKRLAEMTVRSSTPGMTVEVYGANGSALPASITDPAWTQLSPPRTLKKGVRLKLHASTKAFRFVVLWITKAPAASIGTEQAPGHVRVNELVLYSPAT